MKSALLTFVITGVFALLTGVGVGWKIYLPPNGGWSNEPVKADLPACETENALGILLGKTSEELNQTDLATLCLASLGDLSGSGKISLDQMNARLAYLAEQVRADTQRAVDYNKKANP